VFYQQPLQYRAVAAVLILAIAAYRKVRAAREHGEQLNAASCIRRRHLLAVLPLETLPLSITLRRESELHRLDGRRQVRIPDVVPVLPRELRLRHTPWRTPHCPDACALPRSTRRPKPYHPDAHWVSVQMRCVSPPRSAAVGLLALAA